MGGSPKLKFVRAKSRTCFCNDSMRFTWQRYDDDHTTDAYSNTNRIKLTYSLLVTYGSLNFLDQCLINSGTDLALFTE